MDIEPVTLEGSRVRLEPRLIVFTRQMIERWIDYKREREINPLRLRPHPLEFAMYFDI